MELPRKTNHAFEFVNKWALAGETGHGWGNYGKRTIHSDPHTGPYTSTDESLTPPPNPQPTLTSGAPVPLTAKLGKQMDTALGQTQHREPGRRGRARDQVLDRWATFDEVVVRWWTTARYAGPWRQPQRVPEMLFTEWQYRSWALLARYIAERFCVPRNFPLLPAQDRAPGDGNAAAARNDQRRAMSFRVDRARRRGAVAVAGHVHDGRLTSAVATDAQLTAAVPTRRAERRRRSHPNGQRNLLDRASSTSTAASTATASPATPRQRRPRLPRADLRLAPLRARGLGLVVVAVRLRRRPRARRRGRAALLARHAGTATRRSASTTSRRRPPRTPGRARPGHPRRDRLARGRTSSERTRASTRWPTASSWRRGSRPSRRQ